MVWAAAHEVLRLAGLPAVGTDFEAVPFLLQVTGFELAATAVAYCVPAAPLEVVCAALHCITPTAKASTSEVVPALVDATWTVTELPAGATTVNGMEQ